MEKSSEWPKINLAAGTKATEKNPFKKRVEKTVTR